MKKIFLVIAIIASVAISSLPLVGSNLAFANKAAIEGGVNSVGGGGSALDVKSIIANITNTLLFLVGVLSVVFIIWGGLQYVISSGDSGKVTKAKNTIVYAVIGVIVSILAYAIVNFVIGIF